MLILNPKLVTLGTDTLEDVTAVVIDRTATRLVTDWSDLGQHVAFADVAEERIRIRIVQDLARGDLASPGLGELRELSFSTAPTGADSGRRHVTATVVVTGVSHELSRKRGAVRTIECIGVSEDGQTDPISIEDTQEVPI